MANAVFVADGTTKTCTMRDWKALISVNKAGPAWQSIFAGPGPLKFFRLGNFDWRKKYEQLSE